MRQNVVAVLDIRSADITALIGEKGVNNTFVFKGFHSVRYQGYEQGRFCDEEGLARKISAALSRALSGCRDAVSRVTVGVPAAFLTIVNKDAFVGFSSRRKIAPIDIREVYESGYGGKESGGLTLIKSCASYFTLSDNRRAVNPIGLSTSSLGGKMCYIYCSNYFIDLVTEAVNGVGDFDVEFIPSIYAQAMYLIPQDVRNNGAMYIDFGIYSTDVAVVYGDGLVGLVSFEAGEGQMMENVAARYSLSDYAAIDEILSKANLFIRDTGGEKKAMPLERTDLTVYYADVNEDVVAVMDALSEAIEGFLEETQKKLPVPLKAGYVSGDGVLRIRGATDHFTIMLSMVIEVAMPNLPYYKKPGLSSVVSVLDMAQNEARQNGNSLLFKFLKKFGG